jgi:hypothetical protein
MSSLRQIHANRLNARLSTGPVTDEGKKRARQNAIRHGLTAETVIGVLEDAEDYAAFEMAITSDYDAQTSVERELVLRLASLLWRLRRANLIETGLFNLEAKKLLQFRQRRQARPSGSTIVNGLQQYVIAVDEKGDAPNERFELPLSAEAPDRFDAITRSFVHLNNLPTCPLDRLSRYETALWRQACQITLTLQCLNRTKTWKKIVYR